MFKKPGFLKKSTEPGKNKEKYLLLFLVAFFGMMLSFLPSMIANNGIFLYYGDFNSQQEMFYYHANDMVSNGNFGWDWGTDLGSSFIGSYSFYLLGSPFFWISAIFPAKAAAYLIPWLLALKTATAAVTSYAFMRRFVRSTDACFMGAMLYAFSGFQAYNVFFNHFHDVTALFPLLLLGLEMRIQDNRRGPFAIAVAICAAVSYFFFVGEVIFVVIYFFVRCLNKEFDITVRKFFGLIIEAVLGVGIACVIFIPACIDTLNNPRVSGKLAGLDLVVYNDKNRIMRILQSFFMMPDPPARSNVFNSDSARWASIAGYMPLFSMVGVFAFMKTKKHHWASRMVALCVLMALIPGLNSIFYLFNNNYYARWYYMPILIMAMMTAHTIDSNPEALKKSFAPVTIISIAFLAVGMLPKVVDEETVYGEIPKYKDLYYVQASVTIAMIVFLGILLFKFSKSKNFIKITSVATAAGCIFVMCATVWYGVAQGPDNKDYITRAINGGDNLDLSSFDTDDNADNDFYRIDTSENVDNWCMFWGLSSMRCFQSVVPSSLMNFYTEIDQTRNVASRIETRYYALRGLFSVKYYFDENKDNIPVAVGTEHSQLPGFKYVDTQNSFDIYENEYYIPMGFTYDYYISEEAMDDYSQAQKPNVLLNAMVLSTEDILKYCDVLDVYDDTSELTKDSYIATCKEKQLNSCYYFKESSDGFDAKINLEQDKVVFFSVPYDAGWSAQVNGEDVEIIQASYGFMAVKCPVGDTSITFTYKTQGLAIGTGITIFSLATLIIYIGVIHHINKKKGINDVVNGISYDY